MGGMTPSSNHLCHFSFTCGYSAAVCGRPFEHSFELPNGQTGRTRHGQPSGSNGSGHGLILPTFGRRVYGLPADLITGCPAEKGSDMSTPHPSHTPAPTTSSALDQQAAANTAQNLSNVDPPTMQQFTELSESVARLTQRVTALEQQAAALMKHSHQTGGEPVLGGFFNMPSIKAYCQGQQHGFLGADVGTAPPDYDSFNVRLIPNTEGMSPPTPGETGPPILPPPGGN
jgi:hypothetical protein